MNTVINTNMMKLNPVWQLSEPGTDGKSWVRLFRAGKLFYAGEPMEVTEGELDLIAADTNRLIANCEKYASEAGDDRTAWKPPIMAEHESEGGKTFGRITRVKRNGAELFGLVQWKGATWEQVLSEDVEFISPHIVGGYQDSKGETYARVLWEASLTTHPKLKDIGRVQDTLSIRLSDNTTITLNEQEEKQMEELVNELMARFDALEAKIDALGTVEAMDDDEDVEANEGGDDDVEANDAPNVEASERAEEMFRQFSERFGKVETAVVELSKRTSLLTDEPGGDDGKPDGEPTTFEGKFSHYRKKGMSAADAAIAARK